MLLEKEREEKLAVLRGKEKLERDLNSYLHALKDKDNRIAVLTSRVKQLERDNFDTTARLKREAEDYKQQYHSMSRKFRQLQTLLEAQPKPATSPLANDVSPRFPSSLSPTREVFTSKRAVQSPKAGVRPWVSTVSKKGLRPGSAHKPDLTLGGR